ncbi:NosD domain-containing protein [Natronorubrum aibiense]|uniref:Nitrous oxide reductase accessory protein NosL/NosD n=1 Tax=Natronorubrum aibiense TaxID=348826 RepID=A0A5P9P3Q7_9EURY|nr:NosD domain-containing protein [Natronorubrum aibiense]QFU82789.1 nitrous oxide reductase accessory protein NosL/NosD [Natronorubrum aibiense]
MAEPTRYLLLSLALGVLLVGGVGLFVVDTGSTSPDPVLFEDTVKMGVTLENDPDAGDAVEIPKAQVFYSQYEYVVGYQGLERFVDDRQQPGHQERFGYPIAVHVSDFSGTDIELTEDGYPTTDGRVGWTDAESAAFVVGSDAATPAGETVMPFSERDDAEAFASTHGGEVRTWEQLLESNFEIDDAGAVRDRVDDRHARADGQVEASRELVDRPAEITVGEDADTIQDAVDAAPANTTVVVPEGAYEEHVEIDRPITLAGEGNATIQGDGTGTVISVSADRAAVTDLHITGVGNSTRPDDGETTTEGSEGVLEMAYGQGDAGVEVDGANETLIENVVIETPANGVLLRDSPGAIVRNVAVYGSDHWSDGYMGVMTMRSPDGVVEDSRFVDGRDGIYTHRSHDLVYRNNTLERNRIGVHLMYTSNVLIADNRIRNAGSTGIDVMTNPEHNAIVGNEIKHTSQGLLMAGSRSYVADNLITDTDVGVAAGAGNSIYEDNVIAGNVDGMQANHLLPTNQVVGNDFVGNYRHATARVGVLRIWTEDGAGNYWHGAVGQSDGTVLDRSYSPTDPVDERLHRVGGTPTLAQAPASNALAALEGSVSGMRTQSIVDTAPLCEPSNPELLERTEWEAPERECGESAAE